MEVFDSKKVRVCMSLLSEASSPDDALMAWLVLGAQYPNLIGIVCLDSYKRSVLPLSIKKYVKPPTGYLVPYFQTEKIYFLEDELLKSMLTSGQVDFGIDYTLMLDTNIATYINKLVRGESLGNLQSKVVSFVDELLYDDLNFDSLFYMVENIKNVRNLLRKEQDSKIKFWRSLNRGFRNNLVSLQIFRSIDCKEYRRTSSPKPLFTFQNAAKRAVNYSYEFYASKEGREHVMSFVFVQRMMLLQLIGMVKIQLASNKNSKNKMAEYFSYIHEVVGAYFDRETIIAHKYFLDRKNLSVLEKIKKGMPVRGLLKKLDNIAWDMAAPRFMEKLIVSAGDMTGGRYFIPMFVSFDKGLRELLKLFPVKGAIYDKEEGSLIPIPKINTMEYFAAHGCLEGLERLFSGPLRAERMSRGRPTEEEIYLKIRREYKGLRAIVQEAKRK